MLSGIDCSDDLVQDRRRLNWLTVDGHTKTRRLRYHSAIHIAVLTAFVSCCFISICFEGVPFISQRLGVLLVQILYVLVSFRIDASSLRNSRLRCLRSLLFFSVVFPLTIYNCLIYWAWDPLHDLHNHIECKIFAYVVCFLLLLAEWILAPNAQVPGNLWKASYGVVSVLTGVVCGFLLVYRRRSLTVGISESEFQMVDYIAFDMELLRIIVYCALLSLCSTVWALFFTDQVFRKSSCHQWFIKY